MTTVSLDTKKYAKEARLMALYKEQLEGMALEMEKLISEVERRGGTIDHDELETYHEYREDHPKEDA